MSKLSDYGYLCSAGETFDSVSLAVYGKEKYAVDIMCANPELVEKTVFDGSETLFLPVVEVPTEEQERAAPTPPWKE